MNTREVAVVAVVVLLGVAGAALPTVAATTADAVVQSNETNASTAAETATANESDGGSAAFGDQMTAFMQSSASETNDTVESGMWEASFERANESKQARMAHERTDTLDNRLERLRERNRTLAQRYENGSLSQSEYVARASELSGRIAALRTSIDETERATTAAGVNDTRLDALREDARNMTGPETAGVARSVVAGSQGAAGDRGPKPEAQRGDGVGVDTGNETGNASGDQTGPPDATNASTGQDGGENANPSDGGVGTGANGDGSGEASSDDGETGAGDGATQGNGNGVAGGNTGGSDDGPNDGGITGNGEGTNGDDSNGNDANGDGDGANGNGDNGNGNSGDGDGGNGANGNRGNGPSDYTWLFGALHLP